SYRSMSSAARRTGPASFQPARRRHLGQFRVVTRAVALMQIWLSRLQRGDNLPVGGAAGGKESADGADERSENHSQGHDLRRDMEIEGELAPRREAADSRLDVVQRQRKETPDGAADKADHHGF